MLHGDDCRSNIKQLLPQHTKLPVLLIHMREEVSLLAVSAILRP